MYEVIKYKSVNYKYFVWNSGNHVFHTIQGNKLECYCNSKTQKIKSQLFTKKSYHPLQPGENIQPLKKLTFYFVYKNVSWHGVDLRHRPQRVTVIEGERRTTRKETARFEIAGNIANSTIYIQPIFFKSVLSIVESKIINSFVLRLQ